MVGAPRNPHCAPGCERRDDKNDPRPWPELDINNPLIGYTGAYPCEISRNRCWDCQSPNNGMNIGESTCVYRFRSVYLKTGAIPPWRGWLLGGRENICCESLNGCGRGFFPLERQPRLSFRHNLHATNHVQGLGEITEGVIGQQRNPRPFRSRRNSAQVFLRRAASRFRVKIIEDQLTSYFEAEIFECHGAGGHRRPGPGPCIRRMSNRNRGFMIVGRRGTEKARGHTGVGAGTEGRADSAGQR